MVDMFENVVDMVVYCSHLVEPFFCSGGWELIVIIEVYAVWVKAIETSVGAEFVSSGGCGIIGKLCKR